MYLSGSFDWARVLIEKDGYFQPYYEIRGPFNQWKQATLRLEQAEGESIWFEAVSRGNGQGVFALDNVANSPFEVDKCIPVVIQPNAFEPTTGK